MGAKMNPIDTIINNQRYIISLLNELLGKSDHFSNLAEIIEDSNDTEEEEQ